MGTSVTIVLVLLAVLLFLAAKQGWIHNETLQTGANVAAIIALIAAIAVFVVPMPSSPESLSEKSNSTLPESIDDSPSDTNEDFTNQAEENSGSTPTGVVISPTQTPSEENIQNLAHIPVFYKSENRNINGLEIALSPPNLFSGCSRNFDFEMTLTNQTENPIVLGLDERDISLYGNGTDKLSLYGDIGSISPRCYNGFNIETMAPNSSVKLALGTRDSLGSYSFVNLIFGEEAGRLSSEKWQIDISNTNGWEIPGFGERVNVNGLIIVVGEETYFPGCDGTLGFAVYLENTTDSPIVLSFNNYNLNLYGDTGSSMSLYSQEGIQSTECYWNRVDIETIGVGEKIQIATRTTQSLSGLSFVDLIIESDNRLDGLRWRLELPR